MTAGKIRSAFWDRGKKMFVPERRYSMHELERITGIDVSTVRKHLLSQYNREFAFDPVTRKWAKYPGQLIAHDILPTLEELRKTRQDIRQNMKWTGGKPDLQPGYQ
jgi:hypothetical protein